MSELHMHPLWASVKVLNTSDALLTWQQQRRLRRGRVSSSCHRNRTAHEEPSCQETDTGWGKSNCCGFAGKQTGFLLAGPAIKTWSRAGRPASSLSPPVPSAPAQLSHTPPRGADRHSAFGCPAFPAGLLQLESKNLPETVLRRRI